MAGGPHVMAIDAGTGSCRAVIFDAAGRQVALAQREWRHDPEPGVAGSQVFDTANGWDLICQCTHEALAASGLRADQVVGVSATSMREGMVLFDDRGAELWACPNADGRAGLEATELVESGAARAIYERAGDWVAITAPPRFLWLQRNRPELMARTAAVGMLSDWILFRLSGRHVTEPSVGSSSAMFDLETRTWSPELCRLLGVEEQILPEVVEAGTPIGTVTATASGETGLHPETAVVVGGADTQLGHCGISDLLADDLTVVGGTFWQHTALSDAPTIDPRRRLRTLCHVRTDSWMVEGIGFFSGSALRWFRDSFCEPQREAAQRGDDDPYRLMELTAETLEPGAGGVTAIVSNVMQADRWTHASPSFIGFDLASTGARARGQCIRALMEAAVYVAEAHRRILEDLGGRRFERVIFTGGAARSPLWRQILADVSGLPVQVPQITESTALGAAKFAFSGASQEALPAANPLGAPVDPRPDAHHRYGELFADWRELYRRNLDLTEAGLAAPLWRAAGA